MAFSVADFFANGVKQILINSAAQYVGYIGGNRFTPSILLPLFANSKLAADFLQVSHSMPGQTERAATVALVFSMATLRTKTVDIPNDGTSFRNDGTSFREWLKKNNKKTIFIA
jgi:hypothetical protein